MQSLPNCLGSGRQLAIRSAYSPSLAKRERGKRGTWETIKYATTDLPGGGGRLPCVAGGGARAEHSAC